MKTELIVGDHQSQVHLREGWLVLLERGGQKALVEIQRHYLLRENVPLCGCECVEVALVDDVVSGRVHQQFMGIEGATDVITFEHGEIVIGIEVAGRQAAEYGEPELRELFRYLVHGLLHLAGYEDQDAADRRVMEELQERLVTALWPELEGETNC